MSTEAQPPSWPICEDIDTCSQTGTGCRDEHAYAPVRSGADLGRVVRDARTEQGLTQQQVVDEFGLNFDRSRLARIENGEGFQSLDRKNISLLINTETGFVAPAPLYDTVPTALWRVLRATSAMSVNGTLEPTLLHDFVAEAHRWGVGTASGSTASSRTDLRRYYGPRSMLRTRHVRPLQLRAISMKRRSSPGMSGPAGW